VASSWLQGIINEESKSSWPLFLISSPLHRQKGLFMDEKWIIHLHSRRRLVSENSTQLKTESECNTKSVRLAFPLIASSKQLEVVGYQKYLWNYHDISSNHRPLTTYVVYNQQTQLRWPAQVTPSPLLGLSNLDRQSFTLTQDLHVIHTIIDTYTHNTVRNHESIIRFACVSLMWMEWKALANSSKQSGTLSVQGIIFQIPCLELKVFLVVISCGRVLMSFTHSSHRKTKLTRLKDWLWLYFIS
jgi:hypothetical protein